MCLRFVVHGLIPGESYVFRVQAVNIFGLSDESQESSPIAVEPALGNIYNKLYRYTVAVKLKYKCFKMLIKLVGSVENLKKCFRRNR